MFSLVFLKHFINKRDIILFLVSLVMGLLLLTKSLKNSNVYLSFSAGMITCILTVLVVDIYEKCNRYYQLKYLIGDNWSGYAITDRKLVPHLTKSGKEIISHAVINHLYDNIFEIELKHDSDEGLRIWKGILEIDRTVNTIGTITYKYKGEVESGSRRIIIQKSNSKIFMYIIPITNSLAVLKQTPNGIIPSYDYGTEVLVKE